MLTDSRWLLYFSNSAFVTTLAVLGTRVSVAAVAYAFSRIWWPGRNILFLMLSTLMLHARLLGAIYRAAWGVP